VQLPRDCADLALSMVPARISACLKCLIDNLQLMKSHIVQALLHELLYFTCPCRCMLQGRCDTTVNSTDELHASRSCCSRCAEDKRCDRRHCDDKDHLRHDTCRSNGHDQLVIFHHLFFAKLCEEKQLQKITTQTNTSNNTHTSKH
jgi:hypothetical protein